MSLLTNIKSRLLGISVLGLSFVLVPLAFASASASVSIQSLSPSTNVSVGTNLSFTVMTSGFTSPSYSVSDSFSGTSLFSSNINSSGNFSWTPTQVDIGTHTLTVTVTDSLTTATTQEDITVSAAPTVSIQSLSPGSAVAVGQTVYYTVAATGFTNPSYSLSDSFSGSTVSNSDINTSGNFSWTPASQDIGSHDITATVTDSYGHSATVVESLTVNSLGTVVIQSLSPGATSTQGQTVSFTASASGFTNPSFSLSDSFSGTSLTNSNITTAGSFSWIPAVSDVGSHTITVSVTDSSGHAATATQTITIQGIGVVLQSLSPGATVVVSNPLTFTAYASSFTNPVYTISDSFGGSTISNATINASSGYFNWTPVAGDIGTHMITVWATDASGHSAQVTQQIVVEVPTIVINALSPGSSLSTGTQLTFTVLPAGFVNPTYTLADAFAGTTLTSADINSQGSFTWTPTAADIGTHTLVVYATDSYGHSANVSTNIFVTVPTSGATSVIPVTFSQQSLSLTVGQNISLPLAGGAGGGYYVAFNSNASAAEATISNNALSVTGLSSGGAVLVVCTSANNCGALQVTIGITANTTQAGWVLCATEGQQCSFSGTRNVQYGANGKYYYKVLADGAICSNATFGDPASGVVKQCSYSSETTSAPALSSIATFKFTQFLSVGSTGTVVSYLQQRLKNAGVYTGPINGSFGSLTKAAVKKYQAKHGLAQLGYVGPGTRAALNADTD